jgi:hypothetical protein
MTELHLMELQLGHRIILDDLPSGGSWLVSADMQLTCTYISTAQCSTPVNMSNHKDYILHLVVGESYLTSL